MLDGKLLGRHAPAMPRIQSNGIELEYDTFGSATEKPLLLVMGLGTQMIAWDVDFCGQLADRGHHVIRFDNRDIGLSTHFDESGLPNVVELMTAQAEGKELNVPYRLSDMAADAIGLLDGLGFESAHVVGASMGGMIVQTMAIEHSPRVRSMTSIMSNTGSPGGIPPSPEAMAVLMTPPPETREAVIEHGVKNQKVIGSPGFEFDVERARERVAEAFDRSFHPQGSARQLAAITASGSRQEALSQLEVPTLVIHGDADPLVNLQNGIETHEALADSELLVIEGMGHDLPKGAWPRIIDGISALTGRTDS